MQGVAGEGVDMESYKPLSGSARALPDKRLQDRLAAMLACFSARPDCTIPEATSNRNDMDATYGFFQNTRVCPDGVVTTCLSSTLANLEGCCRILSLQDSSDLNYSALDDTAGLGYTDGHDTRGLKLHSTLAIRADDGLVAGLLTQQIWSRPFTQKGRTGQPASSRRQGQGKLSLARPCLRRPLAGPRRQGRPSRRRPRRRHLRLVRRTASGQHAPAGPGGSSSSCRGPRPRRRRGQVGRGGRQANAVGPTPDHGAACGRQAVAPS